MQIKISLRIALLAWAAGGNVSAENFPRVVALEVVTDKAAPGDGGNAWGGHQSRIVRTSDGVFTTYTIPGESDLRREWRLAWRRPDGWKVLAGDLAGREPVSLLAAPDGTLHIIGWPDGKARHWSGKPAAGKLAMQSEAVPGLGEGDWPYGAAGIDGNGRICALSSEGEKPGMFRWAVRDPQSGRWSPGSLDLDYRHCYTYVFPHTGGGLTLVSTRDVLWKTLGYRKPFDRFDYVFNAFAAWTSPDPLKEPLRMILSAEEKPSRREPFVICNGQVDAYIDDRGRVHLIYRKLGDSTRGLEQLRYAVFAPEGQCLADVSVPWHAGPYCRIFQDDKKYLYLLGSDGVIYRGNSNAISFKNKEKLRIGNQLVEESGWALAVPRGGSPPGPFIDAAFPTHWGERWIYCRIQLRGDPR